MKPALVIARIHRRQWQYQQHGRVFRGLLCGGTTARSYNTSPRLDKAKKAKGKLSPPPPPPAARSQQQPRDGKQRGGQQQAATGSQSESQSQSQPQPQPKSSPAPRPLLLDLSPPKHDRPVVGSVYASDKIRVLSTAVKWSSLDFSKIAQGWRALARSLREEIMKPSQARFHAARTAFLLFRKAQRLDGSRSTSKSDPESALREAETIWRRRSTLDGQPPLPLKFLEAFAGDTHAEFNQGGGFFRTSFRKAYYRKRSVDLALGTTRPGTTEKVWVPIWSIDASFRLPVTNASKPSRNRNVPEANLTIHNAYLPGHNIAALRSAPLNIPDRNDAELYVPLSDIDGLSRPKVGAEALAAHERAEGFWKRLNADRDESEDDISDTQRFWQTFKTGIDADEGGASGGGQDDERTPIPFTVSPITAVEAFRSAVSCFDVSVSDNTRLDDNKAQLYWVKEHDELRHYHDSPIEVAPGRYQFHTAGATVEILAIHPLLVPVDVTKFSHPDIATGEPRETLVVQGVWRGAQPAVSTYLPGSLPTEWHYPPRLAEWLNYKHEDLSAVAEYLDNMDSPSLGKAHMNFSPPLDISFTRETEEFLRVEHEWHQKLSYKEIRDFRESNPDATPRALDREFERLNRLRNKRNDRYIDERIEWEHIFSRRLLGLLSLRIEQLKGVSVGAMDDTGGERVGTRAAGTSSSSAGQSTTGGGPTRHPPPPPPPPARPPPPSPSSTSASRPASLRSAPPISSQRLQQPQRAQRPTSNVSAAAATQWWDELEAREKKLAEDRLGLTETREEAAAAAREDYQKKARARFDAVKAASVRALGQSTQEAKDTVRPLQEKLLGLQRALAAFKAQRLVDRAERARAMAEGFSAAEEEELEQEALTLQQMQMGGILSGLRQRATGEAKTVLEEARVSVRAAAEGRRREADEKARRREDRTAAAFAAKMSEAQAEVEEARRSTGLTERAEWLTLWKDRKYTHDTKQELDIVSKMLSTDKTLRAWGDFVDFDDGRIRAFTREAVDENHRFLTALEKYAKERRWANAVNERTVQTIGHVRINGERMTIPEFTRREALKMEKAMPKWMRKENHRSWTGGGRT